MKNISFVLFENPVFCGGRAFALLAPSPADPDRNIVCDQSLENSDDVPPSGAVIISLNGRVRSVCVVKNENRFRLYRRVSITLT